ncbi:hypothetical protein GCM10008994_15530 [Halorubrum ejinorense]|uniref:Uncharacterized protein n=1 Tax=Halorubrum ejinorense TaxID=425309 RepID=A0AAV3SS30_9EURY
MVTNTWSVSATKTNSLIDQLKATELPDVDYVVEASAIVRRDPSRVRENTEPGANELLSEVEVVSEFSPRRRPLTVEVLKGARLSSLTIQFADFSFHTCALLSPFEDWSLSCSALSSPSR